MLLITCSAFATTGKGGGSIGSDSLEVNKMAMKILFKNADKFKVDQETESLSSILAEALSTGETTHNKVSNSCVYDKDDSVFNCSLFILNADDAVKGRTESSMTIRYRLEKDANGVPSQDLFWTSVIVDRAG